MFFNFDPVSFVLLYTSCHRLSYRLPVGVHLKTPTALPDGVIPSQMCFLSDTLTLSFLQFLQRLCNSPVRCSLSENMSFFSILRHFTCACCARGRRPYFYFATRDDCNLTQQVRKLLTSFEILMAAFVSQRRRRTIGVIWC